MQLSQRSHLTDTSADPAVDRLLDLHFLELEDRNGLTRLLAWSPDRSRALLERQSLLVALNHARNPKLSHQSPSEELAFLAQRDLDPSYNGPLVHVLDWPQALEAYDWAHLTQLLKQPSGVASQIASI